jgi:hypothetical protein
MGINACLDVNCVLFFPFFCFIVYNSISRLGRLLESCLDVWPQAIDYCRWRFTRRQQQRHSIGSLIIGYWTLDLYNSASPSQSLNAFYIILHIEMWLDDSIIIVILSGSTISRKRKKLLKPRLKRSRTIRWCARRRRPRNWPKKPKKPTRTNWQVYNI